MSWPNWRSPCTPSTPRSCTARRFSCAARAPGEQIVALNEESYNLSPSNLVIADAEGPIALAGVIGGLYSAIGPQTKRIVLESANFQAASVRKTSVALKLRTDASMRFEKSQDPANTVRGLARALELLEEVSPGIRLVGGLADSHGELKSPAPIELTVEWLKAKLGRDLDAHLVRSILESLEFGVEEPAPGHFPGHGAELARHQRHLDQRRFIGRGGPHGGL